MNKIHELADCVASGNATPDDVKELAKLATEAADDAYRAASIACDTFEDLEHSKNLEPEEQEDFDELRIIQMAYAPKSLRRQ